VQAGLFEWLGFFVLGVERRELSAQNDERNVAFLHFGTRKIKPAVGAQKNVASKILSSKSMGFSDDAQVALLAAV